MASTLMKPADGTDDSPAYRIWTVMNID